MTHDQLAMSIGPAYQKIINAGFVLVQLGGFGFRLNVGIAPHGKAGGIGRP